MTASCALPALTGPPGGPGSGIFKLDRKASVADGAVTF